jgi:hypothetical protein
MIDCTNAHDANVARIAELEAARTTSDSVIAAYAERVAELEAALRQFSEAYDRGPFQLGRALIVARAALNVKG